MNKKELVTLIKHVTMKELKKLYEGYDGDESDDYYGYNSYDDRYSPSLNKRKKTVVTQEAVLANLMFQTRNYFIELDETLMLSDGSEVYKIEAIKPFMGNGKPRISVKCINNGEELKIPYKELNSNDAQLVYDAVYAIIYGE